MLHLFAALSLADPPNVRNSSVGVYGTENVRVEQIEAKQVSQKRLIELVLRCKIDLAVCVSYLAI